MTADRNTWLEPATDGAASPHVPPFSSVSPVTAAVRWSYVTAAYALPDGRVIEVSSVSGWVPAR